jgi:hypothetical protein
MIYSSAESVNNFEPLAWWANDSMPGLVAHNDFRIFSGRRRVKRMERLRR